MTATYQRPVVQINAYKLTIFELYELLQCVKLTKGGRKITIMILSQKRHFPCMKALLKDRCHSRQISQSDTLLISFSILHAYRRHSTIAHAS